ncbi:MAG: ATP-binding protein [bacterium]|nr:ATP-binding protein [bacterium]
MNSHVISVASHKIWLLVMGVLCSFGASFAQASPSNDLLELSVEAQIYSAPNEAMGVDEALILFRQNKVLPNEGLHFGVFSGVQWIYLRIHNRSPAAQEFYLQGSYASVEYLDLYRIGQSPLTPEAHGISIPAAQRKTQHPFPLLRFDLPADTEREYLIRAQNLGQIPLGFDLLSPSELEIKRVHSHLYHGIFYGLLVVAILVSLITWISFKENYLLVFFLLLITELWFISIGDGYFRLIVAPHAGAAEIRAFLMSSLGGMLVFSLALTNSFLDIPKTQPKLAQFTYFLSAAIVLTTLWVVLGAKANGSMLALALVCVATMLVATVIGIKNRVPAAPYFAFAFLSIELAAAAQAMKFLRITEPLERLEDVDIWLHFGFGAEALLLVFALSGRLRNLVIQKQKAQEALIAQEREQVTTLARLDRLKDEFLANTTHELNTPLFGMLGLLENLQTTAAERLTPTERRQIDLATATGQRLTHLIKDILDFSALKNNKLTLRPKTFNLSLLSDFVLSLLRPLVGVKPLELELIKPSQPLWVVADENRLQQILFNLVGNSLKFTHQGKITLELSQDEEFAWVRVRDTGVGIPNSNWNRLFEPYNQEHPEVVSQLGGSGLGLSITLKLIELQGGRLEMQSKPGEGTCFAFCLPLGSPALVEKPQLEVPLAEPSLEPVQKTNNQGPQILVVDDEPGNLSLLNDLLNAQGYRPVLMPGGPEALEWIEENRPDLVLLDLMMPFANGFEVCREIRRHYNAEELPVLLLSGRNAPESLQDAFAAGVNDYIGKPIMGQELMARISLHLRIRENHSLQSRVKLLGAVQEDLAQSHSGLREALEHTSEPVLLLNEHLTPYFINQQARRLLGLKDEERPLLSSLFEGANEVRQVAEQTPTEGQVVALQKTRLKGSQAHLSLARLAKGQWMLNIHQNSEERQDRKLEFRELLVKVMQQSLDLWERASGQNKFDLAERSGIWRIYQDEGRLRTRILDKYCSLKTLPKYPRYMDVLRTALFVLSECPESNAQTNELRENLEALQLLV